MKRDITYIQELLDRYMEGENTQEELRELKEYFLHTDDIPHEFLPYKEMFELLEKPTVIPSVKALEAFTQPKQKRKQIKQLWYWIAAACVAGLVVMLLYPSANEEKDAPQIAKAETKVEKPKEIAPEPLSIVKEEISKDKPKSSKSRPTHSIAKAKAPIVPEVTEEEDDAMEIIVPSDEPKAYATSSDTSTDDNYQDPDKVDEFIAKLALYNHAEKVALKNTSQNDNEQIANVYVFQNNKEIDLFGKLLMVACWYKSDTPGYFLNFSQLQFLFRLKDIKKNRSHLWQAEQIGNKILIYCANVPLGTKINSTIYKEYRQKFIQQNNITF